AFGIVEAMMFHIGIEVAAGSRELRPFALRGLMNVHGMFAGWKALEIEGNFDSRAFGRNLRGAHVFAVGVLQGYLSWLAGRVHGGAKQSRERHSHQFGAECSADHNASLS